MDQMTIDMSPITIEDLQWWTALSRSLVEGQKLTFAKTYAEFAPHSYAVLGRTEGMTREDFIRAAHVIHTFGTPGKYYDSTNIYWVDEASGKKWWTMDWVLDETDLINCADISQIYGEQNAQETQTGKYNRWDAVATRWDTLRNGHDDPQVRRAIKDRYANFAPRTLDVGCGTGWLLDSGLVSRFLYTGVDPSRGMLNALVRKHNEVARVIPKTLDEAFEELQKEKFDLVVAMSVPGLDKSKLEKLAGNGLLLITGGN